MQIRKYAALMVLWSGFSAAAAPAPETMAGNTPEFGNSRFMQVDDVRLHVREWGEKNTTACPVLLVHGFAGSTYSFRELAPALAKAGHSVLAVDLPGFGYSQRAAFSGKAADALWTLLEHEAPGRKWCLLGHSMGAKLTGQMLALKPGQVEAVVYSNGSPLVSSERRKKWFSSSAFIRNTAIRWIETHYLNEKKFREVLSRAYARPASPDETRAYLKPLLIKGTVAAAFAGYAKKWSDDVTAAQIRETRSLVIWGDRDAWAKPELGRALAKSIPDSELLMIAGAGHCPIETHFGASLPRILRNFSAEPRTAKNR